MDTELVCVEHNMELFNFHELSLCFTVRVQFYHLVFRVIRFVSFKQLSKNISIHLNLPAYV
jgi:hypothetical protein